MDPPIHNPTIPGTFLIPNGFRAGRVIRIQGRISPNANGFVINLLSGPNTSHDDIGLHLNPRFTENAVIRNCKNYSSWGVEERQGHFPFSRGQHFEIMILVEPSQYKIAVNGQHFTEFNQRLPLERITHIGIEGDVTVSLIQFEGTSAPSYNTGYNPTAPPPVPMPGAPGAPPYPASSAGTAPVGFVLPPPLPQAYNPGPTASPGYPPPPQMYGGHQQPPQGYPPQGYPQQGYPQQGYPQQGYPQQSPGGYAQPGHGYPSSPSKSGSGGLLDNAGKLLAGGLAGAGLAGLASKVTGKGHHGGHSSYPQPHSHHAGGGGGMGGILGGGLASAAALGVGGMVAGKALKKGKKKNKLLKYGLPAAGLGIGGLALSKGLKHKHHGFGGHSSSSSSSSSEEE